MKRPLAFITVLFCAGVVIAPRSSRISFPVFYLLSWTGLLLSYAFFKRKRCFLICICVQALLLGAAAFKTHAMLPQCHISRRINYSNNVVCAVKGIVGSEHKERQGKTSFLLHAGSIDFPYRRYQCCGKIMVCGKNIPAHGCGEELLITGELFCPSPETRRFRHGTYRGLKDASCLMRVKYPETIVRQKNKSPFSIKRLAFALKHMIEAILSKHTSKATAAVLKAMILGEKSGLSPLVYDSMIKTGTVHILVVSGFNVGLVTFILMLLFKLIRIPRKIRISLTIPLLLVYCLITGASGPVLRATFMALVFLLSYPLKKEADIYTALAFAALCITGYDPDQMFDIGFQLSFASVISIVWLYPRIRVLLSAPAAERWWLRYVLEGFAVSLSAWIGTGGIVAWYFKIFSPVTVIANIIIVPLASLLTLCGFSILITHLAAPALTPLLASSSELFVMLLLKLNSLFISIPGAYVKW